MNIIETLHSWVDNEAGIDITTKTREQHYVFSRTVFFALLRNHTSYSLHEIGKYLGFNHASVLHCANKIFPAFQLTPLAYERYVRMYNKLEKRLLDLEIIEPETIDHAYRLRINTLEQERQMLESKMKRLMNAIKSKRPKYYKELIKELS